MCYIICKNCGRRSLFDYFGFCSVYCCADYSSKHDLSFEDAQSRKIEDLECDNRNLEYDISDLENSLDHITKRNEQLKRTAKEELDIEVKDKLDRIEVTESNLRSANNSCRALEKELKEIKEHKRRQQRVRRKE